ncbi:MAG: HD domain-containing protein [Candidatus Kapabacteria bacterium]|nr:HD domain-containing protein [Candidatus Kapabacteria bacterium]
MSSAVSIELLQKQLEDASTELAQSFLSTIDIMESLISTNERFYDGSHCRFVSAKSALIAQQMGMEGYEIFEIQTAALLHDIGKIGFPDYISSKYYSEFTNEEQKIYYKHPELGKQLLSVNSNFDSIGNIILQHHEKLDGNGFPNHLSGSEIHIGAQIISVVDFYHNAVFRRKRDRTQISDSSLSAINGTALVTQSQKRSTQAVQYLLSKRKTVYNAEVVDLFVRMVEYERENLSEQTILRCSVHQLTEDMIIAQDYYTTYGLLIVAKGEHVKPHIRNALIKFANNGEVPPKILVMR